MKILQLTFLVAACALHGLCPRMEASESSLSEVSVLEDIPYKSGGNLSDYEKKRCMLDVYLPGGKKGRATLVWFHGGGLKAGDKQDVRAMAHSLAQTGLVVVCPNYRLSPKVTFPAYLKDSAAAIAWTHRNIKQHGGDPENLFVGGHSAGGWLTLMVGLDERYLDSCGASPSKLAGLLPVSAQTMTHYTVREERGIGRFTITADEAAPVFYGRKDTPPMLLLYADHDMAARAEENAYFVALMKGAGNEGVSGLLVNDRDHGSIAFRIAEEKDPARLAILKFIQFRSSLRNGSDTP